MKDQRHEGRCQELHEFLPCDLWNDTIEGSTYLVGRQVAEASRSILAATAQALDGMAAMAHDIRIALGCPTWDDIRRRLNR